MVLNSDCLHGTMNSVSYQACLFGPFHFFRSGQLIEQSGWHGKKVKTLMKLFLIDPGKVYSVDQLIDLVCPTLSTKSSVNSLHVALHGLRRLLEPTLAPREPSQFLRRSENLYWFQIDESWRIDTLEVQRSFLKAKDLEKQDDFSAAIPFYRRVVNVCGRGLLPEDTYEDWSIPYRRHYQLMHSYAIGRLIQFHSQHRDFEDVIEYANEALSLDPYSESAMKVIIDAHMQQGNVAKAIQAYERFRQFLKMELGIEPDENMRPDYQARRGK